MKKIEVYLDDRYCIRYVANRKYVCPMLQLKIRNNGDSYTSIEAYCTFAGWEWLGTIKIKVDNADLQIVRCDYCKKKQQDVG